MNYYLGIDLGGTNIAVGVIDENYNFVSKHSTPTLARRPFDVVVADMADASVKALEMAGLTIADIKHIGIGAPSPINPVSQNVMLAGNLGWKNADVIGEFKKHIDIPVFVANDADCAAYGEAIAGAAKNYNNVLMLTLGTGVGGGIILNKKIFLGGNGYGCEPGHVTLVTDGEPCACGRKGCLEAYASVTAFIRDTIRAMAADPCSIMHEMCEHDMRKVNGHTAFDAAKKGDKAGTKVVSNFIHYLASGISGFINLLRPEIVIIGGGVSNQGDYLLEPLRKEVYASVHALEEVPKTPIIKAELGNDAGIIGAAFLCAQYQN